MGSGADYRGRHARLARSIRQPCLFGSARRSLFFQGGQPTEKRRLFFSCPQALCRASRPRKPFQSPSACLDPALQCVQRAARRCYGDAPVNPPSAVLHVNIHGRVNREKLHLVQRWPPFSFRSLVVILDLFFSCPLFPFPFFQLLPSSNCYALLEPLSR